VGRAICWAIFNGSGSEELLVPQGVGEDSTAAVGTVSACRWGRGNLSPFPPTIKNYARTDANKGNSTV